MLESGGKKIVSPSPPMNHIQAKNKSSQIYISLFTWKFLYLHLSFLLPVGFLFWGNGSAPTLNIRTLSYSIPKSKLSTDWCKISESTEVIWCPK